MNEELYTCFQVTNAGIVKRDTGFCVCVSLHTCAGACTDGAACSFYLSRSSAGINILGSDREKHDEGVLKSVPAA